MNIIYCAFVKLLGSMQVANDNETMARNIAVMYGKAQMLDPTQAVVLRRYLTQGVLRSFRCLGLSAAAAAAAAVVPDRLAAPRILHPQQVRYWCRYRYARACGDPPSILADLSFVAQ
jgi:hypothetical protein